LNTLKTASPDSSPNDPRRAGIFEPPSFLETAVDFIEESGGGPGVRLREPTKQKR
jgi:hypothetical protein